MKVSFLLIVGFLIFSCDSKEIVSDEDIGNGDVNDTSTHDNDAKNNTVDSSNIEDLVVQKDLKTYRRESGPWHDPQRYTF